MSTFSVVFIDQTDVDRSFDYPGFVSRQDADEIAACVRENMITARRKGEVVVKRGEVTLTRLPVKGIGHTRR